MEERKYTFYDRYQKVKYANITAEEQEVLNISYNKEHYMFDQQHQRNNTVLFCGLESENGCATDFIADSGCDIASDITTEIFFKELFSDLTEKEKKIVSDYFIMGKQVKETAEELGISTRQVSRDKNSTLAKPKYGEDEFEKFILWKGRKAYIKGKSALMIHDKYPEMVNGWSKSFWARGYYVATVGNITEEAVKEYIQQQKEESKREDTRR